MFDIQTSKYGISALTKSPMITCSLFCSGLVSTCQNCTTMKPLFQTHVPCTRFITSAAILGSISIAVTCFDFSSILTVKFPVPGPTSRTLSVGFKFAYVQYERRIMKKQSQTTNSVYDSKLKVSTFITSVMRDNVHYL